MCASFNHFNRLITTYMCRGLWYQNKKNTINERTHIGTLNEVFNPLHDNVYYSKELREYSIVVLHGFGMMMDRQGKRSCTNFIGRNSKFWGRFVCICHHKDLKDKIPSCSKFKHLLKKRDDMTIVRIV